MSDRPADLLLGELVALIADQDGLIEHAVTGRSLTWDPETRRLWVVKVGGSIPREPSPDDAARAAGFVWDLGAEVELLETHRPIESGSQYFAPLAAIAYRTTKGGAQAEWEHFFDTRPQLWRTQTEWLIRGPVDVSDRGIES